jgi:hypothetical protein
MITAVRHLKAYRFEGGLTIEPCEDPGCGVGDDGVADCGRLACPSCGYGGANLSRYQLAPGEVEPVSCSCGHAWLAGRED